MTDVSRARKEATEGTGRVALCSAFLLIAFRMGFPETSEVEFWGFSWRLCCQRKAAKPFCYQDWIDAFSFETIGTKEKALQKENAVFALAPRGRHL